MAKSIDIDKIDIIPIRKYIGFTLFILLNRNLYI